MTLASGLPDIRISVCSGPLAARQALDDLLRALQPLALSPEDAGTVEVVMAEALNNIVEHAYPEGDVHGPIHVYCSQHDGVLHLTLRDKGRAMPNGATPTGTPADVDVAFDALPEGGFGWFLIKDLARDIVYERIEDENRLSFQLCFPK